MTPGCVPGFFLGAGRRRDHRPVRPAQGDGAVRRRPGGPARRRCRSSTNLVGLVLVSFGLEILTLLWGPAKAASVPHIVPEEHLSSANSLSLVAVASARSRWRAHLLAARRGRRRCSAVRHHLVVQGRPGGARAHLRRDDLPRLGRDRVRLPIPTPSDACETASGSTGPRRSARSRKGLQFVAKHELVRGVMFGLGGRADRRRGDGPARPEVRRGGARRRRRRVRRADDRARIRRRHRRRHAARAPEAPAAHGGVLLRGRSAPAASSSSRPRSRRSRRPRSSSAVVGACAGTAYVTGFTCLQETVSDEMRGRTFADAVHRRAAVPAGLADRLAVVGRLLGLAHREPVRPTRPCTIGRQLRVARCAHRALGRRAHHDRRGVGGLAVDSQGGAGSQPPSRRGAAPSTRVRRSRSARSA